MFLQPDETPNRRSTFDVLRAVKAHRIASKMVSPKAITKKGTVLL